MSRLLIVESPTKARSIERMLGKEYTVIASQGHIRDLPERSLGVDIEHDFTPVYVDTPRSARIVPQLRSAAKKADAIYLAPDPDREGEAIAWHLQNALLDKNTEGKFKRVTFHEITRSAIERALQAPGEVNQNRVDAQQARRVLDRLVGYMISPLLWSQIAKGISAGRVQSVALRLIVEREREIAAFQPQEYWVFELVLRAENGAEFAVKLLKIGGKNIEIGNAADAEKLLADVLAGTAPVVDKVTRSEKKRYAMPPFTTSTLQQSANTILHFSASSTMRYAQELYEGIDLGTGGPAGLITYMRTDSVNIAREAQTAAAEYIRSAYGEKFLPSKFNIYRSKGAAQEAHEAIRPTDVRRTPETMAQYLNEQQLKLYTLIWRRFVASQMSPCLIDQTAIDVDVTGASGKHYTFHTATGVVKFPGCTIVAPDHAEDDNSLNAAVLNSLKDGMATVIADAKREQKFTEPPAHFSEAALVKALEENGIGRPSTYQTIRPTLQGRKYIQTEKGKLIPTELGYKVNDFLVANLNNLFDVGFTASMEGKLDEIEEGKLAWTDMLKNFYGNFRKWLDSVDKPAPAEASAADALVNALAKVKFPKAEKTAGAKRVFDDGRFFRSVERQKKGGKNLSMKQYNALLKLAAKYRDQLDTLPQELAAQLPEAPVQKPVETASAQAPSQDMLRLFAAFSKVTWEEPTKRRGRSFDDKKFFNSLAEQVQAGRTLTEKQLAVLRRLAEKYHGELLDTAFVDHFLKLENVGADAASVEDLAPYFAKLAAVEKWNAPQKRGRFTYDDKAFYTSLKQQFDRGNVLSVRQIAALKKLAAKY